MDTCCDLCGDPTHDTSGHDEVIQARRGKNKSSSQSAESSLAIKCKICGSSVHSTTDHKSLSTFKQAIKAKPSMKRGPRKN